MLKLEDTLKLDISLKLVLELYSTKLFRLWACTLSYSTVTRLIKRFKSGIETVDSAPGRGRPASVVTSKITDKVNDLLKIDARMTTCQVARCLCTSTGSIYKISKKKTKRVSRIAARWIPHSLLDGQKRGRV